jgi:hypothetical protein
MTGTGCRVQLELSLCARGVFLVLCFTSALGGCESPVHFQNEPGLVPGPVCVFW